MIIAVSMSGGSSDAEIDPRFGRAHSFLIVGDDGGEEMVPNPHVAAGGGAGIQTAQLLADRGVTHLLTGNCGPNAYRTLSAAGISLITGCQGSAREAVEACRAGRLQAAPEANVESHFGMGHGRGMGDGRGMGGGRGKGPGRGRGAAPQSGGGAS
jgi:predicted Fe-Mo cluster-binding NifX family protein